VLEDRELEEIRKKKVKRMLEAKGKRAGKVILYSTRTCPYCYMAKQYLSQKGVKYDEVDVGAEPVRAREMMAKSGQMGVPVLDINGKIVVGFDRHSIDKALSAE